jgi:hypothetical protein
VGAKEKALQLLSQEGCYRRTKKGLEVRKERDDGGRSTLGNLTMVMRFIYLISARLKLW